MSVEGGPLTVEFLGSEFAVADRVGLMPLLRFAHAAKSGLDSADMEGMAALYDLLRQSIADETKHVFRGEEITRDAYRDLPPEALGDVTTYGGWDEFEAHATRERAQDVDLMKVIQDVITILSERPTTRPSDSSSGPQSTSHLSAVNSSSLGVVSRLKSAGRPDLALAVVRTRAG